MSAFADQVKYDDKGLVAAIVQDAATSELLMFAWMNREALEETIRTGKAVYYSRSRKKLWRKGESSGHSQVVKELRIDCDQDAILLKVEQVGGACHTGYYSCFYRRLEKDGRLVEVGRKVFDSEKVYGKQGE
ncbi:MAG: phosphoribosyl-AMP cyclohydrolase [bacterium]